MVEKRERTRIRMILLGGVLIAVMFMIPTYIIPLIIGLKDKIIEKNMLPMEDFYFLVYEGMVFI